MTENPDNPVLVPRDLRGMFLFTRRQLYGTVAVSGSLGAVGSWLGHVLVGLLW